MRNTHWMSTVYTQLIQVVKKTPENCDISYGEMLEMASSGAVALQPRSRGVRCHTRGTNSCSQ